MARFRVSCLRESGVTALVKQPEAELILAITASYVPNTSQAEGPQGQLPHRRAAASLETPEQGPESGVCLHHSGPPQMQGEGSSAAEDEHRPGFQRLYKVTAPGPSKSTSL